MVVHQNVLSTIMLKNVKLFNGKVGLHLVTPRIYEYDYFDNIQFLKFFREVTS